MSKELTGVAASPGISIGKVVKDPELISEVEDKIDTEKINAEAAID